MSNRRWVHVTNYVQFVFGDRAVIIGPTYFDGETRNGASTTLMYGELLQTMVNVLNVCNRTWLYGQRLVDCYRSRPNVSLYICYGLMVMGWTNLSVDDCPLNGLIGGKDKETVECIHAQF